MIRPLRDMLVLRVCSQPGKVGAIIIPDSGRQRDKTGVWAEVVAAGPDCTATTKDRVHLDAYGDHPAGDEITHNDQKLVLIRERDIHGIEVKP